MEAHELVAHHLDEMEQVNVTDQASAQVALAHAMAAVGTINQGLLPQPAQVSSAMGSPVSGIVEKLQDWIKRLLDKLTQIVKKLVKGTSFSLSVGTTISVTINFPAMGEA